MIPNSNINVSHYFTEGEPDVKIYSVKFDVHDKYLAAGTSLLMQPAKMEQ
jgi:hypothetical protein